jgi:beta-glucosidase
VDGQVVYDGEQGMGPETDPFEAFFGAPVERGQVTLEAGRAVEVSLFYVVLKIEDIPIKAIAFSLVHGGPRRDPDELIAEAVEAARAADTAIVVVATTERVESEGFDRQDLRLPGRQDDLVRAVAAANPNTVVVVNSGSPVELPWRGDVAAVLLSWFPGQEAGAALADVLLGAEEPGGRLPSTWPVAFEDVPVTQVTPVNGELSYDEGVFIGYRAWDRAGRTPAYPFGHGLGYTDWAYESIDVDPAATTARVRLRNAGSRRGREVVQLYVAPLGLSDTVERPARWLAGFASVELDPGATAEVVIDLPRRAFQIWDESARDWATVAGDYAVEAARSVSDQRLSTAVRVGGRPSA